mgnify:CR=1 FL=1
MSENERIAEIRARVDAATPGPWDERRQDDYACSAYYSIWGGETEVIATDWNDVQYPPTRRADCDLIANAPADLAYLLAENARLRERVAALEVVAGHVEDAWQDEGVHGEGFVFNLNWLLSVARGGELSPYLKDRAALAGQEQAS